MLYVQTITIPAGTQLLNPTVQDMALSYGNLRNAWFHFPPGCRGSVSLAVFHRLQQIIPATPGQVLALDDVLFGFPVGYAIDSLPYVVQLRGWSPDASFGHTVTVYLDVDTAAAEPAAFNPAQLFSLIEGV